MSERVMSKRQVWVANIRPWRLPMTVRAFTIPDTNGEYNIYVNDRLSEEATNAALDHEYDHIVNGDFDKDLPGHILG